MVFMINQQNTKIKKIAKAYTKMFAFLTNVQKSVTNDFFDWNRDFNIRELSEDNAKYEVRGETFDKSFRLGMGSNRSKKRIIESN